jgi:hypothetical protein
VIYAVCASILGEALLKRRSVEASKDNPPLSLVFDRYKNERPVRSIQKEHVRAWKQALPAAVSKRDGKSPVKAATVQKLLNVLRAVLEWANREGIVDTNAARKRRQVFFASTRGMVPSPVENCLPFVIISYADFTSTRGTFPHTLRRAGVVS